MEKKTRQYLLQFAELVMEPAPKHMPQRGKVSPFKNKIFIKFKSHD